MSPVRLTKDTINERLSIHGLTMVGNYTISRDHTEFTCSHGHIFTAKVNNILNRKRCPVCHDNKTPRTTDEINHLLSDRKITIVGPYLGYKMRNIFTAECGHQWEATLQNILLGTNCPECNKGGYRINKPGTFYIFARGNYIKYGIANVIENRLTQHKKYGDLEVIFTATFLDGKIPLLLEGKMRKLFGGRFATKEQCPDGWTETLDKSLTQQVLDTIKNEGIYGQ